MKKTLYIFYLIVSVIACKNDPSKTTQSKNKTTETNSTEIAKTGRLQLKGDFIFFSDAAVLQTTTEVYGVVIDSMMHVLNEKVKVYKKEDTDMVPVAIMGDVTKKPDNEEGWPYRVKVSQILKVYKPDPKSNNIIKLEKEIK